MGISRPDRRQMAAQEQVGEGALRPKQPPREGWRATPPEVEERVCEARSSMLLAPLGLAATTGVPARKGSSPGGACRGSPTSTA